ncbi:MAG TPA: transketolase [Firmicutes bacterium]|nr:transketolase [Bacillota bacterium]
MNPDLIHSLNSLRILSVDMISYAKSGHPGICLGAAPIIFSLYTNHLKFDVKRPDWPNRDRFVMSAGHGSALLYAMLFMAGYDVSIDDLVEFRKLGSKTPGHPEYGKTPGVEVSTGPLGQGFANAVGMALGEKYLASLINEEIPKQKIINYYVYCLCSDGDLMEGVALEAASLAGHYALSNLIVLYDSNGITLDGALNNTYSENILQKFMDIGWEVDFVGDGNDVREIDKAIERAKVNRKPTLIEIKTVIGRGSSHEGENQVHGKPLTKEDMATVRKKYEINSNTLEITENAVRYVRKAVANRMKGVYEDWNKQFEFAKRNNPSLLLQKYLDFVETGNVGINFSSNNFKIQNNYSEELRESNSKIMNIVADRSKLFLGGSADVASSAHTSLYKDVEFSRKEPTGRNISFGLREHAMGAMLNGMALTGLKVFGSTFLSFSDYLKPAIRMTALMNLPVTYIFTHDSVGVGQDGPTHQPIEQLAMLRTIPNLIVFRPADINEVIGCWDFIVNNKKPVALILSKDEAHILDGTSGVNVSKGAYIVRKELQKIDAVLVSTGLDLTNTYLAGETLRAKGIDTRIVSMPSVELFLSQPIEYQNSVIPPNVKVITVEASSTLPWYRFASKGCAIGIDCFGMSGPKDAVLKQLGFDYDSIAAKIENCITNN